MELQELKQMLLDRSWQVVEYLMPSGKMKCDEYCCGDASGSAGSSFYVNLKTGAFYDFADSDVKGSNLLDLWAKSKAMSFADAVSDAKKWLGVDQCKPIEIIPIERRYKLKSKSKEITKPVFESIKINEAKFNECIDDKWIESIQPNYAEIVKAMQSVSDKRKIGMIVGMEIAYKNGCFHICDFDGVRYWVVSDKDKNVAQCRRLDGLPIVMHDGKTTKAKTMKGSKAKIPVGWLPDGCKYIFMFEGSPDFIVGITQSWIELDGNINDIGFIAMLGSIPMDDEYCKNLTDKHVTIFRHNDDAGHAISRTWEKQLKAVKATVSLLQYPKQGYDLNDAFTELIKDGIIKDDSTDYFETSVLNLTRHIKDGSTRSKKRG